MEILPSTFTYQNSFSLLSFRNLTPNIAPYYYFLKLIHTHYALGKPSKNKNKYSRDCGWPRRPSPNAGCKKQKKRQKNQLRKLVITIIIGGYIWGPISEREQGKGFFFVNVLGRLYINSFYPLIFA